MTSLREHAAFTDSYSLLEELWAAGGDYGIERPVRSLLAEALTELTDFERDTPARPVPPWVASADAGFRALDDLLARMQQDVTDLPSTLRLARVRSLVAEARRGS